MSRPEAIQIQSLHHRYPAAKKSAGKGSAAKPALERVDFSVKEGEVFGLLGPNGGGKTTLFKILSTLLSPTSGTAVIAGYDLLKEQADIRKNIGVVFQSPSLDNKLTVKENLIHQGHLYGLTGSDLSGRVSDLLGRLALADRAGDRAEILSGGLKRRVEIAKGLLHRPKILLMDEPSTGLDPGARKDLWDQIAELAGGGMTVCVTTHLMEEAEKCDRLAILNEGSVVAIGTPAALKSEIGGDVLSIETDRPEELARKIEASLGLSAKVVDETVHIEKDHGPETLAAIVKAFSGDIRSISLSKPSLEDVFIRKTGHKFWKSSAEAAR